MDSNDRLDILEKRVNAVTGHRQNAYRDFWLLIITIILGASVWIAVNGANQAKNAVKEVQAQRIDTIWTSCTQQNKRHDNTVRQLDLELAHAPGSKALSRSRRNATILLIDQLAPKQDCRRIVYQATRIPPNASLPPILRQYPPVLPNH